MSYDKLILTYNMFTCVYGVEPSHKIVVGDYDGTIYEITIIDFESY